MKTRQESHAGGIGALGTDLRDRPFLFVILAAALFACGAFGAVALKKASSATATIRAEIVTLDSDADEIDALVRPASYDAGSLHAAIIDATRVEADGEDGLRSSQDWWDDLAVQSTDRAAVFTIALAGGGGDQVRSTLDDLITSFVDQINRRRAQQRREAAAWFERKEAVWQARIEEAKAAILESPFDPGPADTDGSSSSEKLLRLMIDATTGAQASYQEKDRLAGETGRSDDAISNLTLDVARLTDALTHLENGQAAQLEHGTALKEAEAGLEALRERAATILADGNVLDHTAVAVIDPASARHPPYLRYLSALPWPALLATAASASLILALIVTVITSRLYPRAEIAADDYLRDPNWPLPSGAGRDLSRRYAVGSRGSDDRRRQLRSRGNVAG